LFYVVAGAVRRTSHGREATNHEINNVISLDLVSARDRDKGRKSRIADPTIETPAQND